MLGEIYLELLLQTRSCVIHSCPVCLRKWLRVLGEGDMGSSFQHPPLHLLYMVCAFRVAVNAAGLCRGVFFAGITPEK